MTPLRLGQQLFRAAKRLSGTKQAVTCRDGGDLLIRVYAEDGGIYDVRITTYKEPIR